jgi:hypothetical protein
MENQLVPAGTTASLDYVCGTAALRNAHRKASGRDRSGTVVQRRMASQTVHATMS